MKLQTTSHGSGSLEFKVGRIDTMLCAANIYFINGSVRGHYRRFNTDAQCNYTMTSSSTNNVIELATDALTIKQVHDRLIECLKEISEVLTKTQAADGMMSLIGQIEVKYGVAIGWTPCASKLTQEFTIEW